MKTDAHLPATDRFRFPHQFEIPEKRTRAFFALIALVPLYRLHISNTQLHDKHIYAQIYVEIHTPLHLEIFILAETFVFSKQYCKLYFLD